MSNLGHLQAPKRLSLWISSCFAAYASSLVSLHRSAIPLANPSHSDIILGSWEGRNNFLNRSSPRPHPQRAIYK